MSIINHTFCLHCKNVIETPYEGNFCCSGCYCVYNFITTNDLSKYYEILKRIGESDVAKKEWNSQELNQFESESIQSLFRASMNKYCFYLPDMKCAACLWLIESILKKYKDVQLLDLNLMQKKVSLKVEKEAVTSIKNIAKELYLCGYKPFPLPFASSQEFRTEFQREKLKDIAISGFATGNIMLLNLAIYFGKYLGIQENIKNSFYIISMIIAVPSVLYSGRSFFKNLYYTLKMKKNHIDIPIGFALIIILATSIYSTFTKYDSIYFDTLTGLIFLLLVCRYFQEKYIAKAQELGEFIETLLPKESFLIKEGEVIDVAVGQIIPVDGVIVTGSTDVNEAALTGEERAVVKRSSDHVFAGSQNLTQPISILSEKTGHETWIAQLNQLISNAKRNKSNVETQIEKFLPFYTSSIIGLSILSLIVWFFINPMYMVSVFTSLLVVTCPCALAISIPLTFSSSLKCFWKNGVIVKSSQSIETITKVDTVIFDKTGTLTSEKITVKSYKCLNENISPDDIRNALNSLSFVSKRSLHPISKAIASYVNPSVVQQVKIKNIYEHPGLGIEAELISQEEKIIFAKIGNKEFLKRGEDGENENCVYAQVDNLNFVFNLEETLNEGAIDFINFLKGKGIEIFLLSGDSFLNVNRVGKRLLLKEENIKSELKPHDKLEFLEKLQSENKIVLAIGDGINDAAMLAKSQVSIATHGGVDVSIQAADIFLMKKGFKQLINLFNLSFFTLKTLKLLIIISLIYNLFAVVLSFCHLVTPVLAAVLMPISSLLVLMVSLNRSGGKIWKS